MTPPTTTALSEARFRTEPNLGARFVSGGLVYDETFAEGRLMTRYWNPNGQVWPEMHYAGLAWAPEQPADVFQLSIDGRDLTAGWEWVDGEVASDTSRWRCRAGGQCTHSVVRLRHAVAGIEARVHTRLDGSPFLIRWLEIVNLNHEAVGITAVAPFSGMLWSHRYEEHLPPSAAGPFELAFNHRFNWGEEGDFWFEPVAEGCKVVDGGKFGRSGWGRPAFWARNLCNGQTFVCELAWGGNYEFTLDYQRTDVTDSGRKNGALFFRMGLSGYDQALRVLDPGEMVETPAVHLALFQADTDAIVQAIHDHVRHVVMPAQIPGRHVEVEANHRGYLCDRENVADILKDVDVAAAVGAEMYVIDAGWYGNEPNQWWNNTGDWHDGPWMTEGGGLKAVADHAHARGMTFGLWVEIEAVGANSTLKQEHPDWLLTRDGEPIANARALDLTNTAVAQFVESEIDRLIRAYDLDMYRIDHNHCLHPAGNRQYAGFTEDLTWRYYDTFYAVFDCLRAKYPSLVFQNCAGGGGRLDWGTLSRFHNTELSDWMRLPRGLRILNGVTMSLPPEILLRTFGTEVPEHVLEGDLDTQLRLCFSRIIFRGIAPSLEELTPYLKDRITHYLDIYKGHIRPIMEAGARVFHHTPFQPIFAPAPWCVLEYAHPDGSAAVIALYRTSAGGADEFLLKPHGLNPAATYAITSDNSGHTIELPGYELATRGVPVRLETALTSELVLYQRVAS